MAFLRELAGVVKDPSDETSPPGLKYPTLDIGQAREVGAGELVKRLFRGVYSLFDLGGGGAQGRGVLVAGSWLGGEGVSQESLSGDGVLRGTVRGDEGLRLARRQGVTFHRRGQRHLGPTIVCAEPEGHREGQASLVEAPAKLRRQATRQGEAAIDPCLLVSEELGDGRQAQFVVVQERRDDASLVHGPGGLAGGVGGQEPSLHGNTRDGLHHGGDLLPTLALPRHQALEAVDDLEAAARGGGHAQRHGSQRVHWIRTLAAQWRQGVPQLVDGDG
jgi:hypothetical protein